MKADAALVDTANLFLALGDKTRLRLLNLMRDREVCVSSFTGILGQSQPLISRHLAYLRNSGIVEARRDGKWMHYSVSSQLDANTNRLLVELFKWMETQDGLRVDRDKYMEVSGETHSHDHAPAAVVTTSTRSTRSVESEPRRKATATTDASEPLFIPESEPAVESVAKVEAEDIELEPYVEQETEAEYEEPEYEEAEYDESEDEDYRRARHNELEDFLL